MDEGAIRSLLESSVQETDIVMESVGKLDDSYGAHDPYRRSLLGEPWKEITRMEIQRMELQDPAQSLDQIPFRNASIVSKIISGDSNESGHDVIISTSRHDTSKPVTALDRQSNEMSQAEDEVKIDDDAKSLGGPGRASSAIIVKGDLRESPKIWDTSADNTQDKILIEKQ